MSDNFMEKTGILQAEAAKTTRNWRDIVIMASIIEKEARDERDMRLVADVLWKRVDAKIELKVDAAVAYGACLEKYNPARTPTKTKVNTVEEIAE